MILARLLVGDDGSGGAAAALRWAEAVGGASGGQVTVVRAEAGPSGAVPPAQALLAAAGDIAADLIVVGRRGAGGFGALPLGTTAHQVAEHSTRPVAVVPGAPVAASPWPFTTIAVGHDGSPAATAALSWAAALAGASKAAVVVVHALDIAPAFAAAGLDDAYERERDRISTAVADDWCAPLRAAGVAHSTVVEEGGAAVVLVEAVRSHDAGLLVVGRGAGAGFAGMSMGSVAHRALGFSPCPTVVVPLAG